MLRTDHWDPSLIRIVAAAACGLVILAAALGNGALAPRLARWKARRRARRREAHLERLRASLASMASRDSTWESGPTLGHQAPRWRRARAIARRNGLSTGPVNSSG
jgi:hypothetical protein